MVHRILVYVFNTHHTTDSLSSFGKVWPGATMVGEEIHQSDKPAALGIACYHTALAYTGPA